MDGQETAYFMKDFYGVLNHTHDQESGTGSICVWGVGGGGIILGDLKGDNLHPDFRSPQAGISKLGPFLIGSYRLKGSLII